MAIIFKSLVAKWAEDFDSTLMNQQAQIFSGAHFHHSVTVVQFLSVKTWHLCNFIWCNTEPATETLSTILYIILLHGIAGVGYFFYKTLVLFLPGCILVAENCKWTHFVQQCTKPTWILHVRWLSARGLGRIAAGIGHTVIMTGSACTQAQTVNSKAHGHSIYVCKYILLIAC